MSLIGLFITILFICVIVALFYWVIGALGTPDPMGRIARVAIIFVGSLMVICILFNRFGNIHIMAIK